MKKLYFLSGNKDLIATLKESNLNDSFELNFINDPSGIDSLKVNSLKDEEEVILYLDSAFFESVDDLYRYLEEKFLNRKEFPVGILDVEKKLNDPIMLLYRGFFDYISGLNFLELLSPERISSALNFFRKVQNLIGLKEYKGKSGKDTRVGVLNDEKLFSYDWESVEENNEYLFWIMYLKIDNLESLRESFSIELKNRILGYFKNFVEREVIQNNGRVWIWSEAGGVILFPYDGGNKIDALTSALRLILNRKIFNFELNNSHDIEYHIVLHIGSTVYKTPGKTGTIVSDDINRIFHIGEDFNDVSLIVSESVIDILPEKSRDYFASISEYENIEIFKFKGPISK